MYDPAGLFLKNKIEKKPYDELSWRPCSYANIVPKPTVTVGFANGRRALFKLFFLIDDSNQIFLENQHVVP